MCQHTPGFSLYVFSHAAFDYLDYCASRVCVVQKLTSIYKVVEQLAFAFYYMISFSESMYSLAHFNNGYVFAGNLAFPLLLVGGLFLLSRRQGGGMGGPGGNNPMNFGKSKAKFQMEPNTGITFADVAGVEEAKADFIEVRMQNHCQLSTWWRADALGSHSCIFAAASERRCACTRGCHRLKQPGIASVLHCAHFVWTGTLQLHCLLVSIVTTLYVFWSGSGVSEEA